MSCSFSHQIPKALPALSPSHHQQHTTTSLSNLTCKHNKPTNNSIKKHDKKLITNTTRKPNDCFGANKSRLALQVGALLATFEQPALAVTGVNYEEDLIWVLIQLGICAFVYFLLMPPVIMNWLRIRWYKRGVLEMYLQFMFVFIFFPGIMLWAPFINFRKLPRDPSLKYPWSTPEDPSKVKGGFLKYPFAKPEDYS